MNGGFPPIKFCKTNKPDKNSSDPKMRFFSNVPKQNINIREILSTEKPKPILLATNTDSEVEAVNEL